jgi:hypothetical protein
MTGSPYRWGRNLSTNGAIPAGQRLRMVISHGCQESENTTSLPAGREARRQRISVRVALGVQGGFQDIGGLRPLSSLDDIKLDTLSFFEGFESLAE